MAVTPPYAYSTEEVKPYLVDWLRRRDPALVDRLEKIIASIQIARRASAIPIETIFEPRSFEEKNNLYIECAIELASQAFGEALTAAQLAPTDIDFLITTSCTGFMIPSVDAHIANRFGMKRELQRLPVIQMGCAGGTAGLIYATDYLRANPTHRAAVVTAEFPSITMQLDDLSMANIVSTTLFADGTACAILAGSEVESDGAAYPHICDKQMVHMPDTASVMGYRLTDTGLQIVLERIVPDVIEENLDSILTPFLERNDVSIADLDHLIFHPGSIKILNRTEELIAAYGKDLRYSHEVLERHGNMSSATVMFILARVMEEAGKKGDRGLMLSFGPGFCGQTLLLDWH